ncbi:MAG TPA: hemolysin family protein [Candidatus Saccharimonadales bacterium]|nr:hemolysin family protein [Candidatus Saccharimonadales bacterium]
MTEFLLIILALLLVAACGIFVAAEFSLITVNRNTVGRLAAKGDRKSQGVAEALKTLSTQLSGAQVGITITNLAIGFLAEPAIATLIKGPLAAIGVPDAGVSSIAIVTGITIATIVTMVFGELVPKNLAIARPLATARFVQNTQRLFSRIMKYPIKLLNGSANFILHRIGIAAQEELASARTADELASLVRRSAEKGTLPKETALMLERSLVFDELTALDVMTPRVRMRTLQADAPMSSVIDLTKATGLSRFPVIGKNLDDVVGIVHVKHVFGTPAAQRQTLSISRITQPPILVPSSIQLDALLETLRKGGLQMAVVIDEFGGTDGLVTIEDLLEELVGEVHDEHDRSGVAIRKRSGGGWILSGLLRADEVGEEIGIFLPEEEDFETVGGLIIHLLERIPEVGDSIETEAVDRDGRSVAVRLSVERMDGRRVDRLHMETTAHDTSAAKGANA